MLAYYAISVCTVHYERNSKTGVGFNGIIDSECITFFFYDVKWPKSKQIKHACSVVFDGRKALFNNSSPAVSGNTRREATMTRGAQRLVPLKRPWVSAQVCTYHYLIMCTQALAYGGRLLRSEQRERTRSRTPAAVAWIQRVCGCLLIGGGRVVGHSLIRLVHSKK